MPRIPDANQLGYSVARPRTPEFVDRSAQIAGQATERFAGTIGNIADALQSDADTFDTALADSDLQREHTAVVKEFEQDRDWRTFEKRYGERMAAASERANKRFSNNRARTAFEVNSRNILERGKQAIQGLARTKEVDWGRAQVDEALTANRNSALEAPDEQTRAAIIGSSQSLIDGAVARGYLNEQEATNQRQRWSQDYAESYVGMQQAPERIKILSAPKGTVADMIAPDRRAAMLEAAKKEDRDLTVRRESQAAEDALVEKHGGNWTAALTDARSIKDPEVRDSTVSRIKTRQAEAKQAEIEAQDSLGEEALAFINDGGKFADLPLRIKNGLKPSALNSLRAYAEQSAGGSRRTDPQTLIELSSKSVDDPQAFGDINMMEYRDKLSDQDFEEFVDLQRKIRTGTLDGKDTGYQSIVNVRDARLRELFGATTGKGAKQTKINDFVMKFENELKAFKAETGKPAKADDARKILDNLTAEVAINWGSDKKVFELDGEDIEGVPAADRAEIIRELQKRGKPVTDAAIVGLYQAVNGATKAP